MQDTTNSVWCFARLFHYPGAELLQAISLYCLRHWHRFKPQELANMIWSLALLRACSPHTWCARLCTAPYLAASSARGPVLCSAFCTLATLTLYGGKLLRTSAFCTLADITSLRYLGSSVLDICAACHLGHKTSLAVAAL